MLLGAYYAILAEPTAGQIFISISFPTFEYLPSRWQKDIKFAL